MRILLDTSAYSAFSRGHPAVVAAVRRSGSVFLSAIVVGELLFGFHHGSRPDENRARLEAFLDDPHVTLLPVTLTTADRFGRIATALRQEGTPIPTNDIWIAAHALEAGADLLSSDQHFAHVDGLAWLPFSPAGGESVRERTYAAYAVPPDGDTGH